MATDDDRTATPPPPPPPPVTPPAVGGQVTLVGRIRRPRIAVRGVTHLLIDGQGRVWLLRAAGENREELDDILEDVEEEDEEELALVRGIVEQTVQGLPVVRVTFADEFEDDDDDNNSNGVFATVVPQNPTQNLTPVQRAELATALSRLGAARGVYVPPINLLRGLLIVMLQAQRSGRPIGML